MPRVTAAAKSSRADILNADLGIISESFRLNGATVGASAIGTTTATSNLQGMLVPLRAGEVITNLVCFSVTAGASVTLFKMGLYTKAGVYLAGSADQKALLGTNVFVVAPLTGTYTVTSDGSYYVLMIALASAGTSPTLARGANTTMTNTLGNRAAANVSAQSDIGSNVTPGDASNSFWVACT